MDKKDYKKLYEGLHKSMLISNSELASFRYRNQKLQEKLGFFIDRTIKLEKELKDKIEKAKKAKKAKRSQ